MIFVRYNVLCVDSCFASISLVRRELVTLLCLTSWSLVIAVLLFLTMPRVCLQFVFVVFPDHTHLYVDVSMNANSKNNE